VLPPAFHLDDSSAPYWQLHLVNSAGISMNMSMFDLSCRSFIAACHAVLSLSPQVRHSPKMRSNKFEKLLLYLTNAERWC
jgi:hypothetical protein